MAPGATLEEEPFQAQKSSFFSKVSTVRASVLHGPRDLRLQVRSLDDPQPGEVQVAIKATGICGSDVSYYTKFANGDLCACMPLALGHESAGVVVALGPHVTGLEVGDRVALEVGVAACGGACAICRQGRYNLCKQMRFRSSAKSVPHYQGTLQERINHPAAWCHKLPAHISYDAAALLEPLAVAIHAVNRASPVLPGSTALVIGAGTVGLLTAAVARSAGCSQVTIADVDAGRVQYALSKGFATHGKVVPRPTTTTTTTPTPSGATLLDTQLAAARLLAADLLALTQPPLSHVASDPDNEGVDLTFECTGKEACMQTSLYATKPGGKVVMVGMGTPIQTLPISVAHLREIDIVGVFRYANTYPAGIRMLSTPGALISKLDDMVTHRFRGLEAAKEAFEVAGRTSDEEGNLVIKVVIEGIEC